MPPTPFNGPSLGHPRNKATDAQVDYIMILLNDVGLSERDRQLAHLKDIAHRKELLAVGDLTKFEASICIGKLKEWKENEHPPR